MPAGLGSHGENEHSCSLPSGHRVCSLLFLCEFQGPVKRGNLQMWGRLTLVQPFVKRPLRTYTLILLPFKKLFSSWEENSIHVLLSNIKHFHIVAFPGSLIRTEYWKYGTGLVDNFLQIA